MLRIYVAFYTRGYARPLSARCLTHPIIACVVVVVVVVVVVLLLLLDLMLESVTLYRLTGCLPTSLYPYRLAHAPSHPLP